MKQNSSLSVLWKGILKENPVFVLILGTCPTLATTTNVAGAFGMGIAALAVLVCSNILISLLRKIIPDSVRIPCYIVVIAGFVTIVQMIVQAYFPALYDMLGADRRRIIGSRPSSFSAAFTPATKPCTAASS